MDEGFGDTDGMVEAILRGSVLRVILLPSRTVESDTETVSLPSQLDKIKCGTGIILQIRKNTSKFMFV